MGRGRVKEATRESPDLSRNAKYRNQLSRLGIKKRVWNILLHIKFCSQQINWKPAPGGRYFDKLFGGEEAPRPETNIICWYLFCKSICGFILRNCWKICCKKHFANILRNALVQKRQQGQVVSLFPFKRRMPNSQLQNLYREMSWFETDKNKK